MSALFGTSIRRDAGDGRGLRARIDGLILERLEEALDTVCLEVLVQARQRAQRPAPAADSAADRDEFGELVAAFLQQLHEGIVTAVSAGERSPWMSASSGGPRDRAALLGVQVRLAKRLPDYWQRFDRIREQFTIEQRNKPAARAGFLGQIFGRRSG